MKKEAKLGSNLIMKQEYNFPDLVIVMKMEFDDVTSESIIIIIMVS